MALFDMQDFKSFLKYCFWGMIIWSLFGIVLLAILTNSISIEGGVAAKHFKFLQSAFLFNILAGIILGGLVYISMVISGFTELEFLIFLLPLSMGALVGFIEIHHIYPSLAHRLGIVMNVPFYNDILGIICGMISIPVIIKYARRFHNYYG
ncbi:MAG: hypothetical protein PHQ57_03055 [Candidatus Omnitrophica bacterium]|nr:hypothetical protein [Candidatus Omnitrophota bacterium]